MGRRACASAARSPARDSPCRRSPSSPGRRRSRTACPCPSGSRRAGRGFAAMTSSIACSIAPRVRDLPQALRLDDRVRVLALRPHRLEHVLGDLAGDRAVDDAREQARERVARRPATAPISRPSRLRKPDSSPITQFAASFGSPPAPRGDALEVVAPSRGSRSARRRRSPTGRARARSARPSRPAAPAACARTSSMNASSSATGSRSGSGK